MSDTFPAYFTERKDLESLMLGAQILISITFIRRIVDIANGMVAFRKDWSILGYLLSLRESSLWL